jgi:hypothetical protein
VDANDLLLIVVFIHPGPLVPNPIRMQVGTTCSLSYVICVPVMDKMNHCNFILLQDNPFFYCIDQFWAHLLELARYQLVLAPKG